MSRPRGSLVQLCKCRKRTTDAAPKNKLVLVKLYKLSKPPLFSVPLLVLVERLGHCHSPLPVWLVVAGVWELEEGTDATQDSPNGTSIINLNFETRNKNNL